MAKPVTPFHYRRLLLLISQIAADDGWVERCSLMLPAALAHLGEPGDVEQLIEDLRNADLVECRRGRGVALTEHGHALLWPGRAGHTQPPARPSAAKVWSPCDPRGTSPAA